MLGRFGRFGVAVTIVEGESERKAIQVMATELLVDIQVSLLCLFFYFFIIFFKRRCFVCPSTGAEICVPHSCQPALPL
jgi:hypothetical protein